MIINKNVQVTFNIEIEIDTDQIGEDIHGGWAETPEEIANEAKKFFTENLELFNTFPYDGIKEINQSYF